MTANGWGYGLIFNDLKEISIMASTGVYISDKELEDLYNNLEKGSLVRLLIEKHRQLEKQVKKLTI